jgi:hypothetical protein
MYKTDDLLMAGTAKFELYDAQNGTFPNEIFPALFKK